MVTDKHSIYREMMRSSGSTVKMMYFFTLEKIQSLEFELEKKELPKNERKLLLRRLKELNKLANMLMCLNW